MFKQTNQTNICTDIYNYLMYVIYYRMTLIAIVLKGSQEIFGSQK